MKAYVLINASPGRALEVAKKMEGVSGISAAHSRDDLERAVRAFVESRAELN